MQNYQFFNPSEPVDITQRHLPHWEQRNAYYFITFRTADSMPAEVLHEWYQDRDVWLLAHGIDPTLEVWQREVEVLANANHEEFYRTFTAKWHELLDAGHGECRLRESSLSAIVAENLRHFDGDRYGLEAFMVMPNHVHVLVGVAGRGTMRRQCRSWKNYTAARINKQLGRSGQFWQWESFDHLVRSPGSLEKFRRYIEQNPVKAKLRAGEYALYVREAR